MAEATKNTKEKISKQTLKKRLNDKREEPKTRSKRYLSLSEKVNTNEALPLTDAINKVKETATTKFDSSIELHIHLTAKKGKKGSEDEYARGIIHLPQGLGKTRKVVILTEDMIEAIAKTQKLDFDVAIATPSLMSKLGRVAKILGTKGKMPNPKAGTVTDKPEVIKQEIEAGRVEYRQDQGRNVHQMIGKASWETDKLIENAKAVIAIFTQNRIDSVALTSSMGPSIKINLEA